MGNPGTGGGSVDGLAPIGLLPARVVDRHREDLAAALRGRGLVVMTSVGLSDFQVDLSLALASRPDRAVTAVLLDSPAWAARRTTGDRDGLPATVLGQIMGWPEVARVWLPAWLSDPEAVLDDLVARTEAAVARLRFIGESRVSNVLVGRDLETDRDVQEDGADLAGVTGEVTQFERSETGADLPTQGEAPLRTEGSRSRAASDSPSPGSEADGPSPGSKTDGPSPGFESDSFSPGSETDGPSLGSEADVPHSKTGAEVGLPIDIDLSGRDLGASGVVSTTDSGPGEDYVPYPTEVLGGRSILDGLTSGRSTERVRRLIGQIVEGEGPIGVERIARLVLASCGITRLQSARLAEIGRVIPPDLRRDNEGFRWPAGRDPLTWTGFRRSPSMKDRPLDEIALREIGNAMVFVATAAMGIGHEELFKQVCRLFGGTRVTEPVAARFTEILKIELRQGRLQLRGGVVTAA